MDSQLLFSLSLPDYIKHIFFEDKILTLYNILLALKKYKIMSDSELEEFITRDYAKFLDAPTESDDMYTYLDMHKFKKVVEREPRLRKLEEDNQIVIEVVNRSSVNVYVPLGVKINKFEVENFISIAECQYFKVAPDWVYDILYDDYQYRYRLLYKAIIYDAMKYQASDVHLTAISSGKSVLYPVYYRINEDYILSETYGYISRDDQKEMVSAMLSTTPYQITNLDDLHGASTAVQDVFGPGTVILRVNVTVNFGGFDFSARIQTQDSLGLTIRTLGFDAKAENSLMKTSKRKSGLTIVTGKFKSGKTITMMALAKETSKYPVKQYGIFSPMEFKVPFGVKEYNDKLDVLLSEVSQIKKKDIDVVYINEIPNTDVGLAAWDLINSNVHVVTTTHLNRIWHLPHKLYEIYGTRFRDLMTQLNVVYNQKMFIKLCPHCSEEVPLDLGRVDPLYRDFMLKHNLNHYYEAKGCPYCVNGKMIGGYHPLVEFVEFNYDLVNTLLQCGTNAEMESVLFNHVMGEKASLEYKVAEDIEKGILGLDAVLHFI